MTEQITTPEALDALPVGSIVLLADGRAAEVRDAGTSGGRHLRTFNGADHWRPERLLPLTVLRRPDAPAAVERAARAIVGAGMTGAGLTIAGPLASHLARAALAAARPCTCQGPSPCSDGPDVDCPQHGDGRAAARDGVWATDTDGGGSLCSSCGIGHDRGECTSAAPTVTAEQVHAAWDLTGGRIVPLSWARQFLRNLGIEVREP